jgi:hypothetical protein
MYATTDQLRVCVWNVYIWKWLEYALNSNEILAKNRPDHTHTI